jgi:hypothetical protein
MIGHLSLLLRFNNEFTIAVILSIVRKSKYSFVYIVLHFLQISSHSVQTYFSSDKHQLRSKPIIEHL